MAEYDGEIRIKASLETNDFNNQAKELIDKFDKQNILLDKQRAKVKNLQEQYDNLINHVTKTTEENAIARSLKKAQEELKNLEHAYMTASFSLEADKSLGKATSKSVLEDINKYNRVLSTVTQLKARMQEIRMDPGSTESAKKLAGELKLAELEASKLERNIDATKLSLTQLHKASKFSFFDSANSQFDNIKKSLKSLGEGALGVFSRIGASVSSFGQRILKLAGSAFVFNLISSGFRELSHGIGKLVSQDSILTSYLSRVRFNLLTAFAPIYQYVLPSLRALFQMLEIVTSKIAVFMSTLFGKALPQSQAMAREIIDSVGQSSKALSKQATNLGKVGKSAKKSADALASFDKIEVLVLKHAKKNKPEAMGGDSGIGIQSLGLASSRVDTIGINMLTQALNRLKEPLKDLNFGRASESLGLLRDTLASYTRGAGEVLLWLYDNVFAKFITWSVNELIPRFLDLLRASLEALKPIIVQTRDDLKWLWDEFLSKIAEWTGNKINAGLEFLTDRIKSLGSRISENKILLEFLSAFLIGITAGAMIVGLGSLSTSIGALIPKVVGLTVAMLANPWTWAVAGIGAVISSIILITKHWDEMQKYFGLAWEFFKLAIDGMKEYLQGLVDVIENIIGLVTNIINGNWYDAWENAVGIVRGAIREISGLIKGIFGIFNGIKSSIFGAGSFIKDVITGGFGYRSISSPIYNSISPNRSIPAFASGAVLEGGNPMLAYLNDQPKGQTNIETPLNTMVDAFNRSLNQRNNGNVVIEASGDVGKLISFLHFKLRQEDSRVGSSMVKGDVWI